MLKTLVVWMLTLFCLAPVLGQRLVDQGVLTIGLSDQGELIATSEKGELKRLDDAPATIMGRLDDPEQKTIIYKGQAWTFNDDAINCATDKTYSQEGVVDMIVFSGHLYALSHTGILRFSNEDWDLIGRCNFAINSDAQLRVVDGGLYLLNANQLIHVDRQGQCSSMALATERLNDIVTYKDKIWVATDKGLYVLNANALKKVKLGMDHVNGVVTKLASNSEYLVIATEDKIMTWSEDHYVTKDIASHSKINSLVVDEWENLWYTDAGKLYFADISSSIDLPLFKAVTINGQLNPSTINLESGADLSIEYYAAYPGDMDGIQYGIQLSPIDDEYRDWTNKNQAFYSDLPEGNYLLRVRASLDQTNNSFSTPINIQVKEKSTISKASWWMLASLLGLLLFAVFAQYRANQFRQKSNLLSEQLRTTKALLKSKEKTAQLQMNPHFLFNALNSIQGLVALDRKKEAKLYLQKFSSLMRMTLEFSDSDKITLAQEIKYLDDYLSIEQMTRSNAFQYAIEYDEDLETEDIELPSMLIQPFVENAIVHGLAGVREGLIKITIRDLGTILQVEILDNGKGRAATKDKSTHKSMAVNIVKDRIASLGKHPDAGVFYEDLYQNEIPSGTQVRLGIPIV